MNNIKKNSKVIIADLEKLKKRHADDIKRYWELLDNEQSRERFRLIEERCEKQDVATVTKLVDTNYVNLQFEDGWEMGIDPKFLKLHIPMTYEQVVELLDNPEINRTAKAIQILNDNRINEIKLLRKFCVKVKVPKFAYDKDSVVSMQEALIKRLIGFRINSNVIINS